jgi:hypothetical protein
MAAAMNKAGRSIDDLGGRVTESWWNPEYTTPEDGARGFEPGAVMGKVIPYPAVKALLEADPKALAVSINAWPKGAHEGTGSTGERGMVIEGFRREPQGSVDWVINAGAGGGVVAEERAVSLLEALYDPANDPGGDVSKLSEMTEDEFRAHVAAEAPHLLDALSDGQEITVTGLSEERVQEMLDEQAERFETRLAESVEERATQIVTERDQRRSFSTRALEKIDKAEGLTDGHRADLRARYTISDDGSPGAGLLVESAEKLDEGVEADVKHALDLIRESRPGPRVSGLGGGGEEKSERPQRSGGWAGALQEMELMPLDADGNPDKAKLLDGMVN